MTEPKRPTALTYLVTRFQQALRAEAEEGLREVGVTLPQLGVLRTLASQPGASNAALARYTFVSPQSMSELVAGLEQRGLVSRSPDPDNARVLRRSLTRAGLRIVQVGVAAVARAEERLVAPLAAREREQLRGLLQSCVDGLAQERGS